MGNFLIAFRKVWTKILAPSFIQLHSCDLLEKTWLKLSLLKQNSFQLDYIPESYARYLVSYSKCEKKCYTHKVWTVPPSPEPLCETLGMGENPTQQPKIYWFPPSEKFPLINLNLSLSKVTFLPHQIAIFK